MNLDRYKPMNDRGSADLFNVSNTPFVRNYSPESSGLAGMSSHNMSNETNRLNEQNAKALAILEAKSSLYDPTNSLVNNATSVNNNYKHNPYTGAYVDKLVSAESGGDYNAYNKGSGAMGRYQFMPDTVTPFLNKRGKSIADFRSTPSLQDDIFREFTDNNRRGLRNAGYDTSDINLYGAHQQGLAGIIDILKGGSKYTKNISSNIPSNMEPTGANWLNHWSPRFS